MTAEKPAAEMPPTGDLGYCVEKGCYNDAIANGRCEKHQAGPSKTRGRQRKTPEPIAPPVTAKKVTRIEVESMIVPSMLLLSTIIDEAYQPVDIIEDREGNKSAKVRPHVDEAIEQMMPWMEIYGHAFTRFFPWFGLIGGCCTLMLPAIEPTIEIVAGIRKPRILRKHPKDFYTEAYVEAQAKRAQKAAKESADAAAADASGKSGTGPFLERLA